MTGRAQLPASETGGLAGAACQECVAVYLERAGVVLTLGAAERVDCLAGYDAGEPAVLQHLLPARTGQPAGYSTGPQVDVAQCLDGQPSSRRHGWPRQARAGLDVGEPERLGGLAGLASISGVMSMPITCPMKLLAWAGSRLVFWPGE
jgi:hypothetical protein